jgi:hypothetical protein
MLTGHMTKKHPDWVLVCSQRAQPTRRQSCESGCSPGRCGYYVASKRTHYSVGDLQVMKYDRVIAELSLVRSLNSFFPSPQLLHPRIILANKDQATHKSTPPYCSRRIIIRFLKQSYQFQSKNTTLHPCVPFRWQVEA